jgi:uncharacterized protein DUF4421
MNLRSLIPVIFIFFSYSLIGQDNVEVYIQDYSSDFILKLYSKVNSHNFAIEDKLTSTKIEYSPNFQLNTGIGFNYKWLGLGFAFKAPLVNDDDDKFGKTTSFDIQANIYSKKIIVDLNYLYYQGFYLSNAEKLYDIEKLDTFPSRGDITSASIGGSFYFIVNGDKFSYKSAFINNEFQKESAGSLIFGSFISLYGMSVDSTVIPIEFRDSINANLHVKAANGFNIGTSFGYVHTFVTKDNFFITAGLVPGLGLQSNVRELATGEILENEIGLALKVQVRLAFGYNRDKHFGVISLVNDTYAITDEENQILNYGFGNVKITFGLRF